MTKKKSNFYEMVEAKRYLFLETGKRPASFVTDNPVDIPSLGGENISDDGFLRFDNIRYISKDYFNGISKGIIRSEDILINKDGANTGKLAFVQKLPFNDAMINEHLFIIRSTEEFNQKYLFYFLLSQKGQNQIKSKVVGSAQGGISNSFIKRLYIPKPARAVQDNIAEIISKVDDAIEVTKKLIVKTRVIKSTLMKSLLSGKIRTDGRSRLANEYYIDHKIGKVPKGWVVGRFKEFSVLQRGKDLTDSSVICGPYPVIKSNGFTVRHNSYFVEPPGVVTGRSGTIGNVFYIEEKFWAHNTALYIKDFKGNDPRFIYYLISEMKFERYLAGTGVPTLNRNDIHRLRIMIPSDVVEQKSIANKIKSLEDFIKTKENMVDVLNILKRSLMQNLVTGKIRITVE